MEGVFTRDLGPSLGLPSTEGLHARQHSQLQFVVQPSVPLTVKSPVGPSGEVARTPTLPSASYGLQSLAATNSLLRYLDPGTHLAVSIPLVPQLKLRRWFDFKVASDFSFGRRGRPKVRAHAFAFTGHVALMRKLSRIISNLCSCPVLSETLTCSNTACPADCVTTSWTAWSTCAHTCGSASSSRSRAVSTPAVGSGSCAAFLTETTTCMAAVSSCAVDCVLTAWSAWGTCSASCSEGSKVPSRG